MLHQCLTISWSLQHSLPSPSSYITHPSSVFDFITWHFISVCVCVLMYSPARSGSLSLRKAPVIVGRLLLWREQKTQYETCVPSEQQLDVSKAPVDADDVALWFVHLRWVYGLCVDCCVSVWFQQRVTDGHKYPGIHFGTQCCRGEHTHADTHTGARLKNKNQN